jgi:hypothetical protein
MLNLLQRLKQVHENFVGKKNIFNHILIQIKNMNLKLNNSYLFFHILLNDMELKWQVTRLKCGGFILALSLNHTLGDAVGLRLFINAWAEMARGVNQPSILPVWRREILIARDPPHITCNHREYEQIILPSNTIIKEEDTITTIHQSFFFTPAHIAAIRCLVPLHLRQCTTFDLIAACYWRCRTKALQLKPEEEARMMCVVNARSRFVANDSSLVGYYGNCIAFPAAVTTAGSFVETH